MNSNKMRHILKWTLLIVALIIALPSAAATPAAELKATVDKLAAAKSVKAQFTTTAGGHTVGGTLLSKGSKFSITMAGAGSWYDGKTLTTYSKANGEATMWIPTKSELAETNPLLYLSTYADYNVATEKGKAGENVFVLTPKKRGSGVKSVKVTVNSSTKLPKSLRIATGSEVYTVTIKSMTLNAAIADGSFTFPKKSYPGVTVTDLR
ncbi:MAG: outer membrane lipoprotein carrier protein LolA [Muribaculaceae bacterium]|nr:outer membrane lipoprotein carrier protein LolA [Muribaculaceae bacterium]